MWLLLLVVVVVVQGPCPAGYESGGLHQEDDGGLRKPRPDLHPGRHVAQQVPRQQVRAAFVCAATDLLKIEKGEKRYLFYI